MCLKTEVRLRDTVNAESVGSGNFSNLLSELYGVMNLHQSYSTAVAGDCACLITKYFRESIGVSVANSSAAGSLGIS
jgi:hypothetical protein